MWVYGCVWAIILTHDTDSPLLAAQVLTNPWDFAYYFRKIFTFFYNPQCSPRITFVGGALIIYLSSEELVVFLCFRCRKNPGILGPNLRSYLWNLSRECIHATTAISMICKWMIILGGKPDSREITLLTNPRAIRIKQKL